MGNRRVGGILFHSGGFNVLATLVLVISLEDAMCDLPMTGQLSDANSCLGSL